MTTSRLSNFLSTFVALAFVGAVGFAVVRGVSAEPSIVGSFAVAGASLAAVVWGRQREKDLDLRQSHREAMAPIYEEFFSKVYGMKPDDGLTDETRVFLEEFQRKLVLFAPTPVVLAYVTWMRGLELPSPEPMLLYENLYLAIRKDLGHDNSALEAGDLLRIWVYDSDGFLKP